MTIKETNMQAEEQEGSIFFHYYYVLQELYLIGVLFYPIYLNYRGTLKISLIFLGLLVALLWTINRYCKHCRVISYLNALEKMLTPKTLPWYVILLLAVFVITIIMRLFITINPWLELIKNIGIWLLLILRQFVENRNTTKLRT